MKDQSIKLSHMRELLSQWVQRKETNHAWNDRTLIEKQVEQTLNWIVQNASVDEAVTHNFGSSFVIHAEISDTWPPEYQYTLTEADMLLFWVV